LVGKCKYCEKEIHWSKESGSWLPYEDEGRIIRHNCKKPPEIVTAVRQVVPSTQATGPPPERIQADPLTPEEVFILRKMIQSLEVRVT
jgi:hypothetical protein